MRAMRGLHIIRSGAAVPRLVGAVARAEGDGGEPAADGRLATLEVDFSRFDAWYEIDSFWEGRFLERIKRGAFKRTIKNSGGNVKVLFNHGFDFNIGDKVLGVPEVLEERDDSPHLEAGLLDTTYNRDLLPGLRAGAYGSSFMFEVLAESWREEPERTEGNPDGIPERTITEVRLFEAGPVTWPANPDATAGVRCGTDWLAEQVRSKRDQAQYDELVRSFAAFRALHGLDAVPSVTPAGPDPKTAAPDTGSARHVGGVSATARKRRLALIDMARR